MYPRWLKQEIEHSVGELYLDPRHLGFMTTDHRCDKILEGLVRIENHRMQITAYLLKKYPVDVMMFVSRPPIPCNTSFGTYMDPTHPSYDPSGAEKYGDEIREIYRALDTDIATLLDAIPPECTVIVLSDHGGGPVSGNIIHLHQYRHELGLLAYKNGSAGSPKRLLHRGMGGLDGYLRGVLSPRQKKPPSYASSHAARKVGIICHCSQHDRLAKDTGVLPGVLGFSFGNLDQPRRPHAAWHC